MPFLKKVFSKADKFARKRRHERVKQEVKKLNRKKAALNMLPKNPEKEFLWHIFSIGTFVFFIFSILPNFTATGADFWIPIEKENIENEKYALADEGFLMQPAIQTKRGSRENITEVIEILTESGDTIWTIAQKYGISVETIVQNNNIKNPSRLKTGQKLVILPVDGLLHKVKEKENISSIAKKYKIEKEKIITQNDLEKEKNLKIGQKIIIPGYIKKSIKKIPTKRRIYTASANISSGKDYGGRLFFPCQGRYTQFYHYGHYAVDIAKNGGSPIWSAEGGKVTKAQGGWNGGYGNIVIIDHGNGIKTLYAHLKEIYVNVGQHVARGQAIGYMGNTGRVYGRTGIHLHFEVIVKGVKKNPIAYF